MATGKILPNFIRKDIVIDSRTYNHLTGFSYDCASILPSGYRVGFAFVKTADSVGDALNFMVSPTLEGTWIRIYNSSSTADFTMSITVSLFLIKLW